MREEDRTTAIVVVADGAREVAVRLTLEGEEHGLEEWLMDKVV